MEHNERGRCKDCKHVVLWARTDEGKLMPVDPGEEPVNANLQLYRGAATGSLRVRVVEPGKGTFMPHFATCSERRHGTTAIAVGAHR